MMNVTASLSRSVCVMGATEAELSHTVRMHRKKEAAGVLVLISWWRTWWRVAQSSDLQGDTRRSSQITRPDPSTPGPLLCKRDKLLWRQHCCPSVCVCMWVCVCVWSVCSDSTHQSSLVVLISAVFHVESQTVFKWVKNFSTEQWNDILSSLE